MSMTTQTLGLGRKVLYDAYTVEAAKVAPQWRDIVGRVDKTTQVYETIKQIKGLGPAEPTPEGESVRFDDYAPLFQRNFTPYLVTKGLRYTELMEETLQYKDILSKQPAFAKSFGMTRNQVVANMLNLGFTDTTYGMNSEALFSTSHATANPGVTGSNRPSTDLALSPLAVERGLAELRRQKSAIGQPMPVTGKVKLIVPPELEGPARRIVNSMRMAFTANNDDNWFKDRLEVVVNDYLTSATAWFLVAAGDGENNMFLLEQLPYRIDKLAMTKELLIQWVARESYIPGWADWRGVWGTTGA